MLSATSLSVFDMFRVGIGPSSSHTVGPMRAAKRFALALEEQGLMNEVKQVRIALHGSLGATGRGHATDIGVILGLLGRDPEKVDAQSVSAEIGAIHAAKEIHLLDRHRISFRRDTDILFLGDEPLPAHPNALRFSAMGDEGSVIHSATFLSVGGGFIVDAAEADSPALGSPSHQLPYPFSSGAELLKHARSSGLSIASLTLANEAVHRTVTQVNESLLSIWQVMADCVRSGTSPDVAEECLPGPMRVKRRAPSLHRMLTDRVTSDSHAQSAQMDWVNLYAMAVNEENAAGGRVVTAPTNGAAGVIPAVLHYHLRFTEGATSSDAVEFLLTAGAIGMLYKLNASISGAEVGCQGEVGVACSMAAAGLTAVLGGTPSQVENAAEIGMEHHLGLTCDPVGGMVQIPCIERNAMGAVKAINAARMALLGTGQHHVSLDAVMKTMAQTGADMKSKYKETSLGGLAVNVVEC